MSDDPDTLASTVTVSRADLAWAMGDGTRTGIGDGMEAHRLRAALEYVPHVTPAGGQNDHGIVIEDNQSRDCFSIRSDNHDGTEDLIHFCDWPALRDAIDKHQGERTGDW